MSYMLLVSLLGCYLSLLEFLAKKVVFFDLSSFSWQHPPPISGAIFKLSFRVGRKASCNVLLLLLHIGNSQGSMEIIKCGKSLGSAGQSVGDHLLPAQDVEGWEASGNLNLRSTFHCYPSSSCSDHVHGLGSGRMLLKQ